MTGPKSIRFEKPAEIPNSAWECLARKRVFFGHQSVGQNIIEGLADVVPGIPSLPLRVALADSPGSLKGPVLAHGGIGKNCDPLSKCEAFGILMARIHREVDVALFKFCYVDIDGRTDVRQLFEKYEGLFADLGRRYPEVRFVHVTAPLSAVPMDLKSRVKRAIGYPVWIDDCNIRRSEFNRLLRQRYAGKEPIFDLESVESTHADGGRATFRRGRNTYPALAPEYTDDGGHLNRAGRKTAAEQFLVALAKAACDGNGKR